VYGLKNILVQSDFILSDNPYTLYTQNSHVTAAQLPPLFQSAVSRSPSVLAQCNRVETKIIIMKFKEGMGIFSLISERNVTFNKSVVLWTPLFF